MRWVLVRALRDSLCYLSQGGDCSSFDLRVVWDGNQLLAEDRQSTPSSLQTTGTVAYVHGPGLDQPLAILDSRVGMDGRVPHGNWRGLGESSSWTDGTPADCSLMGGPCTLINWPAGQGVYFEKPQSQSGPSQPATWVGSLVANGEDGTSLLYRRNRFYDPASGQFTQQDPIGIGGGLNVYGFAAGDPVNFGDPFGLSCEGLWKDELAALDGFGEQEGCPAGETAWPVGPPGGSLASITSPFGANTPGRYKIPGASRPHRGVDQGVPVGTGVGSMAAGVVKNVGITNDNGYFVEVQHFSEPRDDATYTSFYIELGGPPVVQIGDLVIAGTTLGFSGGTTGISNGGPHLHFELQRNGKVIDPTKCLPK